LSAAKYVLERSVPILEEAFDHFLIIALDEEVDPPLPISLAHGDTHYCLRLLEMAKKDLAKHIEASK